MGVLKDIVDLLVVRREAKKRELEIEKLEAEKSKRTHLIERASLSDIEKYDPKRQELLQIARTQDRAAKEAWSSRQASWPAILLRHLVVLGLVALLIWLVWRVA